MAGFEKINFSLSDDSARGAQSRLRELTRDAGGGGLSGMSAQSKRAGGPGRPPPSPETASRIYIQTYLEDTESEDLATIASPDRPELVPDLRLVSSGATDPLTADSAVFDQTWKGVAVFGGRLVVDVDAGDRSLVSINGQLAPPPDLSPVATLSAKQALLRAEEWASHGTVPEESSPELSWYFDDTIERWHLTWHISAVPLAPPEGDSGAEPLEHDHRFCLGPSPRSRAGLIDVFVDANDGEVVFFFSSLPTLNVPIPMTGDDADGVSRNFFGLQTPTGFVLSDPLRNIITFDYTYQDIDSEPLPPLPPDPIGNPSHNLGSANPAAVSAHFNATRVFDFFNNVLKRDGVDDRGMQLVSVVNVWSSKRGTEARDWLNAVWWKERMWYGQTAGRSLATHLDVIGHELTHGVTQSTSNLIYRDIPGALNESYSDIFGIIIANWYPNEPEPIANWKWELGAGLGSNDGAMRNFADPAAAGQPDHFSQYRPLPLSHDNGGVHIYSGIHNKAIYNLLTDIDAAENPTFPARDAALLLYLTLSRLTRTSDFHDSRRTLESVTKAFYGRDPAVRSIRLKAIESAFHQVGL